MPIKSGNDIERELIESGKRMKEVRERAEALREAEKLPETEPRQPTGTVTQTPSPGIRQR